VCFVFLIIFFTKIQNEADDQRDFVIALAGSGSEMDLDEFNSYFEQQVEIKPSLRFKALFLHAQRLQKESDTFNVFIFVVCFLFIYKPSKNVQPSSLGPCEGMEEKMYLTIELAKKYPNITSKEFGVIFEKQAGTKADLKIVTKFLQEQKVEKMLQKKKHSVSSVSPSLSSSLVRTTSSSQQHKLSSSPSTNEPQRNQFSSSFKKNASPSSSSSTTTPSKRTATEVPRPTDMQGPNPPVEIIVPDYEFVGLLCFLFFIFFLCRKKINKFSEIKS
jgi:hypothetical protein